MVRTAQAAPGHTGAGSEAAFHTLSLFSKVSAGSDCQALTTASATSDGDRPSVSTVQSARR